MHFLTPLESVNLAREKNIFCNLALLFRSEGGLIKNSFRNDLAGETLVGWDQWWKNQKRNISNTTADSYNLLYNFWKLPLHPWLDFFVFSAMSRRLSFTGPYFCIHIRVILSFVVIFIWPFQSFFNIKEDIFNTFCMLSW